MLLRNETSMLQPEAHEHASVGCNTKECGVVKSLFRSIRNLGAESPSSRID